MFLGCPKLYLQSQIYKIFKKTREFRFCRTTFIDERHLILLIFQTYLSDICILLRIRTQEINLLQLLITNTSNTYLTTLLEISVSCKIFTFFTLQDVVVEDRDCYMCQINTAIMKKQVGCVDVLGKYVYPFNWIYVNLFYLFITKGKKIAIKRYNNQLNYNFLKRKVEVQVY